MKPFQSGSSSIVCSHLTIDEIHAFRLRIFTNECQHQMERIHRQEKN